MSRNRLDDDECSSDDAVTTDGGSGTATGPTSSSLSLSAVVGGGGDDEGEGEGQHSSCSWWPAAGSSSGTVAADTRHVPTLVVRVVPVRAAIFLCCTVAATLLGGGVLVLRSGGYGNGIQHNASLAKASEQQQHQPASLHHLLRRDVDDDASSLRQDEGRRLGEVGARMARSDAGGGGAAVTGSTGSSSSISSSGDWGGWVRKSLESLLNMGGVVGWEDDSEHDDIDDDHDDDDIDGDYNDHHHQQQQQLFNSTTRSSSSRQLQPSYQTIQGFPCYRTVSGTFATMSDLARRYPKIVQVKSIGRTYENRDMRVLIVTNRSRPRKRPGGRLVKGVMFLMSGLHARELATVELCLRFVEWMCRGYGVDADRTRVVDYTEIHVLLIANVDGRRIAEDDIDYYWRKNDNPTNGGCRTRGGKHGIDLNRNFAFMWGRNSGSSPDPCSETYRGPRAASEVETQAIQRYAKSIFPRKQRKGKFAEKTYFDMVNEKKAWGLFLDVHAYGELNIFPWGFRDDLRVANFDSYYALASKLAFFNGYTLSASGLPDFLYEVSGDSVDYMFGKLGIPSMLLELGNSFDEPCRNFEGKIYGDNRDALFYAAKVCRLPLRLANGPDIAAIATRSSDGGDDTVIVTARLHRRNAFSVLRDVYCYVDADPLDRPLPKRYPMQIRTGEATLALDTADLAAGRHTVCCEVIDVKRVKGPVTCEYFEVR